jgi:gluconate transporter
MSILLLVACIGLLLVLISVFDVSAFLALLVTALVAGFAQGMEPLAIIESIKKGIGTTLGSVTLILGLGVMLGTILSESGAAQQISQRMLQYFGVKRAKLAVVLTGFVVGIAMFYNAGFLILIPLIFTISSQTGLSPVYLGIAMASSLSVTHGYLPPHPGPIAIVGTLKADLGLTLIYGLIVALPASLIAGLIFPEFIKNIKANPPKGLFNNTTKPNSALPPFGISVGIALLPVLLMAFATVCELGLIKNEQYLAYIKFFGDPTISLLLVLLLALYFLGVKQGKNLKELSASIQASVGAAAMLLLIIAAGGAFKQILDDGGIKNDISQLFTNSTLSPLFLGWLIAFIIRVSIGSATVAAITAAGIIAPSLENGQTSAELMVLAIGAGSLMCSHVNDSGFWMFKEYFGLSVKDTFKTWTALETIVGIVGLLCVLALNMLIH